MTVFEEVFELNDADELCEAVAAFKAPNDPDRFISGGESGEDIWGIPLGGVLYGGFAMVPAGGGIVSLLQRGVSRGRPTGFTLAARQQFPTFDEVELECDGDNEELGCVARQ